MPTPLKKRELVMFKRIFLYTLLFNLSVYIYPLHELNVQVDPLLVIVIMVKNEAHIEREEPVIIETLKPYVDAGIDAFLVFDTGSTDDTIEVTKDYFKTKGIERGYIKQEPFIDFAASRNRALELAEQQFPNGCFMLMPDAEWYMHNVKGLIAFCKKEVFNFHISNYSIRTLSFMHDYTQQRLFRIGSKSRFVGVVHECLDTYTPHKAPNDVYFEFRRSSQGNERSGQRWKRDLVLLKNAYKEKPDDARTTFYLAQTYDCLGKWKQAYKYYNIRVKLGGWQEEAFVAQFRMGQMAEHLEQQEPTDWMLPLYNYIRAFAMYPHRAEPLIALSKYFLEKGDHHTAFVFAQRACQIPYPKDDILFVEKYFYDYIRWDVLGQCAWYVGYFDMGEDAVQSALKAQPDKIHLHENLEIYQSRRAKYAGK